jgi:hypothetical protein
MMRLKERSVRTFEELEYMGAQKENRATVLKNARNSLLRSLLSGCCAALAMSTTIGCKEDTAFFPSIHRSDMFVQEYVDSRYDFLWVIDNSGTMAPRRQLIRDNMQGFLQILNSRKAIDFQMAVTTGDYISHNGDLVQTESGLKVVKSATSTNPVSEFAALVDAVVDSPNSFWQQGLEAAYQAISRNKSLFSREGAPLIVVFVTDADDYSCQTNCFGREPIRNPDTRIYPIDRYATYFKNLKKGENSDTYLFPIIPLDSTTCSVETAGYRYIQVMKYLGNFGTSGSVCAQNIHDSYNAIARIIADRGNVFKLSAKASGYGIKVYVNGGLVESKPENYIYDSSLNAIIFTGYAPTSGSMIQVSYSQNTT